MSFGAIMTAVCPLCGYKGFWITYEVNPPPIPMRVHGGWLSDETGEDGQWPACPRCEDETLDSFTESIEEGALTFTERVGA